ncbi:hypothetical protein XENTR_v10022414 [Xenopus tropicalis]|nr:hypothetical protein XENTR_v10022414 [Xenopus tropicalis]KAE8588219.1 hypothetical protein XENTR_v10022414 [Xenopus tropicalis]
MEPAECVPEDTNIRWKSHEKYQEIGFYRRRLISGISPQFLNRVDCNGDTRVTIRNLSRADSGLYILSYTLQCKVKRDVKYHDLTVYVQCYHWQKGNNETGYLHYMNGPYIQVSLHSQSLGTLDEEFICTVCNPANQKSTSIHIKDICTLMADSSIHLNKPQRPSQLDESIFITCSTTAFVILAVITIIVVNGIGKHLSNGLSSPK